MRSCEKMARLNGGAVALFRARGAWSTRSRGVYLGCVLILQQLFEIEGKWLMKAERESGAKFESLILLCQYAAA